jgi:hypothetical protein
MGSSSKPLYKRHTHPTTAEVGLFGPLLFRCHTPASMFINEYRFGRIEAGWIWGQWETYIDGTKQPKGGPTHESSRKWIPYFMSSRRSLCFHPAWGVPSAVGEMGRGLCLKWIMHQRCGHLYHSQILTSNAFAAFVALTVNRAGRWVATSLHETVTCLLRIEHLSSVVFVKNHHNLYL